MPPEMRSDLPHWVKGGIEHWPALRRWSLAHLAACFAQEQVFLTEDLATARPIRKMRFPDYCAYVRHSAAREPADPVLYASRFQPMASDQLADDWEQPPHENLFLKLAPAAKRRYLCRFGWLLLSPRGGVASRHTDLFSTHAWLAVVWGCKRVRVWEPDPTGDQPYVESWLTAGDLFYIPPRWPHDVLNVEPTLAVTFNGIRESQLSGLRAAVAANHSAWCSHWGLGPMQADVDGFLGIGETLQRA